MRFSESHKNNFRFWSHLLDT